MKKTCNILPLTVLALSLLFIMTGCGGGGDSDSGQGTQPLTAYSQADLAGEWYINILQTYPTGTPLIGLWGWARGNATIAASGTMTASPLFTNPAQPFNLSGSVLTINPVTGLITWSAGSSLTVFHGRMAANKQLIVGTTSLYIGPVPSDVSQFCILQKRNPAITYSTADISNKSFLLSQIETGDSSSNWMFARGATDAFALVNMPVLTYATGTVTGGAAGTLSIDQVSGLVTISSNTWFQGMMSPDKTYIVATETDANDATKHRLTVIHMRNQAQTFSQADLAGTYDYHSLTTHYGWTYGTQVTGSTGSLTITSFTSNWQPSIGPITSTRLISSEGIISDPSNTSHHGVLSSTKDFLVQTRTSGSGPECNFTISIK